MAQYFRVEALQGEEQGWVAVRRRGATRGARGARGATMTARGTRTAPRGTHSHSHRATRGTNRQGARGRPRGISQYFLILL